jgi:hypothetical protein
MPMRVGVAILSWFGKLEGNIFPVWCFDESGSTGISKWISSQG